MSQNKSPFGGVSGLSVSGTEVPSETSVKLAVSLELDEGLNRAPMKCTNAFIQWDGVGTIAYTAIAGAVEVVFSYAHLSSEKCIHLSTTIHFNPYGYVTLPDCTLSLDRGRSASTFRIPHDIVGEHFSVSGSGSGSTDDLNLEVIYGKRVSSPLRNGNVKNYAVLGATAKKRKCATIPSLQEMGTFLEEKKKRDDEERTHVDTVLMPAWGDEIESAVRAMFRSPKRVRQLVRQWQVHAVRHPFCLFC
jgi:hypothetical protein